ncbi:DUF4360 domain-containing protein [Leucothrix pacifica]|uniref:DUF4360 domain-containing protein n=1 Tax=Leucothrix pacifica TaxID=1247513 RepID=A0A317CNK4_9GAMM|nr:DUF4360 domain-containing protein [Leucothrix pacifica]PWQ99767.1 hypothetical protein DKW60_04645 [Leucothrix pacifica]
MKWFLALFSCISLVACNSGGSKKELPFSDISINSATFSGVGCPGDDDDYLISADKKVITLLLGDYRAEAGYGTAVNSSRVTCNMAISLDVPMGYRVMLLDADFRGNVSLPDVGSFAEFKREYFFADGSSPILTDHWDGELSNESVQIFDGLEEYGGRLSNCGEDVILRTNTSLYISVPDDGDTSEIAIDSLDFKGRAQFDYHLDYVACD